MERRAEGTGSWRSRSLEEPAAQLSAFNPDLYVTDWHSAAWNNYSEQCFDIPTSSNYAGSSLSLDSRFSFEDPLRSPEWFEGLDSDRIPSPITGNFLGDFEDYYVFDHNPPPTQGDPLALWGDFGINVSSDVSSPTRMASTPALTNGAPTPQSQASALSPRPIGRILNSSRHVFYSFKSNSILTQM